LQREYSRFSGGARNICADRETVEQTSMIQLNLSTLVLRVSRSQLSQQAAADEIDQVVARCSREAEGPLTAAGQMRGA